MKNPSSSVTTITNVHRSDRRTVHQNDAPNKAKIQTIIPKNETPSIERDRRSATPNLLSAEMWLLQGGGVKKGSSQKAPVASTSLSSKASKSPSKSTIPIQERPLHSQNYQSHDHRKHQPPPPTPPSQRGRSPNHRSPSKRSSSSEVHHHHNHHTTSISPSTFVVSRHPTSLVSPTNQRVSKTRPQKVTTQIGVTTPSKRPTNIVVPSSPVCPIPSIYISHIRKAFGGAGGASSSNHKSNSSSRRPIDLYTEVLGLPHQQHPYTDTQIRVAYFRQGRLVLQEQQQQQCDGKQQQQSSSPNSTIIQDQEVNTNMMPSKQRFQAITKAYEIVTNPYYKDYYETHGLPPLKLDAPTLADVAPHQPPKREPVARKNSSPITQSSRHVDPIVDDRNDIDDTNCMMPKVIDDDDDDIGSVVSIGSILRNSNNDKHRHQQRSKSWGPVASSSRQRVVWKEEVQELIYQPDPPTNQSIEIMEQQQQRQILDSQSNPTSKYIFSEATFPNDVNQHQQDIEDRDFLDDLEASVDGIGATIGNFVKYLSEHDVSNHTIEVKDDDENDFIYSEQNHVPRTKSPKETNDMQLEHQLFKETNKEKSTETIDVNEMSSIPSSDGDGGGAYAKRIAEYHRRSHSCDNKTSFRRERCISITTTSTAPLKEGKTDQEPRKKPKKSKRKKKCGVDKVPSNMTDIDNGTNDEFFFDPFQHSIDDSIDFGAVDPLIDAWKTPATSNDYCVYDPISPIKNTVHSNSKFDAYELPEVSSILASLDGATQEPRSIDLDVEKSLSFDDALNRTTDATTKGYIRLDRRANSLSAVMDNRVSSMDVSEITYSSNVSDDPAGRHFHFAFLTSMAQSAKATIKEIASFDEENDDKVETGKNKNGVATASTTQNQSTPKSNDTTDQPKDVDILSQFNTFMISFVEDMNKLGTQLSTNLIETNRAVRDTMTFPEAEVSGFLERIGTGLNFTKSADQTDSNLHQSFTY